MRRLALLCAVVALLAVLLACTQVATPLPTATKAPPTSPPADTPPPAETPAEAVEPTATEGAAADVGLTGEELVALAVETLQQAGCGACHEIAGVPGAEGQIGPSLSELGRVAQERLQSAEYTGSATTAEEYIRESIVDPNAYTVSECPGGPCVAGQMPTTYGQTLTPEQLEAVVAYLVSLPEGAAQVPAEATPVAEAEGPPPLTEEELARAKEIYFNNCAGCHGTLRKGATGPALTPDTTRPKGTEALAAIIFSGTPRGMPAWGAEGRLTREEVELMAKFVQHDPPPPPEMSMEQMMASWQVFVPPEERPTEPQHDRDWENFFSVTLRDAGQVAIIDGDTKEIVSVVDTGYAVHISRMSATGRYVYTIGRDGKAVLIDLWMEKPDKVAEVKVCYDARSIEVSKYRGELGDFYDKYAIVGCYWPPHFVILDGQTLEPIKVVSTRGYTYDTEEFHPEPRVASIVASHFSPEWVVNVKETGHVWLVDYSDPNNPSIKMIEAELFLHDGGWDATRRYFLVAANARNKIAVVDTKERELEALVDVGDTPHPGRGVNFVDPEYGPVWCTVHLGEPLLSCIGTDPENNPEYAWKAVRNVELLGGGSLFVKSHPNSRWIWVDFPLNPDEEVQRSVCVIDKENPAEIAKCWQVADYGRAVHIEYNKAGDEVWISVWGSADTPGKTGELVIYDDATLEEKARIKDLVTPTGKFNVYNTANDIY